MEQGRNPTVAVYCITRGKLDLTRKSLKLLRNNAGMKFRLYVVDQDSGKEMRRYLKAAKDGGQIHWLHLSDVNLGQNIAANLMLDQIEEDGGADYVLRWDPDAIPYDRRFLKKLVQCAETFNKEGHIVVVSPKIGKLKNEPEVFAEGDDVGFKYQAVKILGGICRLHPWRIFDGWRFNKFGPLGFGEALEMADRCLDMGVPKLRIPHLIVDHAYGEDGQAERWPEMFTFEAKEIGRYVGYGL